MDKKKNIARAKKIKILLMDVDGVLTDGKMYYIPGHKGEMVEFKAFHSLDGIGLRLLNQFGILTGVITGRESPGTEERARNLGMSYVYQGFLSKLDPLLEILKDTGLKAEKYLDWRPTEMHAWLEETINWFFFKYIGPLPKNYASRKKELELAQQWKMRV